MSKIYRVGAIGTAWAARSPLPSFKTYPRTELVAIASARLARAQEAATNFGAAHAFDDYRQMYAMDDIDIIYVGAPVDLHHPMAIEAAAAGKHILCEKPLSRNVKEGREMVDAFESRGLAHVTAFTMRNYPVFQHIRNLIDQGVLGDLRHVSITEFRGAPAGAPPRTWTWLNDANKGGGFLGGMGSHFIDIMRFLGYEFRSVFGQTRIWRPEVPGDDGKTYEATAEDSFGFLATLDTGAVMTVQLSSVVRPGTGRRVELYGSNGTIVIEGEDKLSVATGTDSELKPVEIPAPAFSADVMSTAVPRFGKMIELLIEQIEGGAHARPDLEDALRCQEVMDAIRLSQQRGAVVSIDELRS